jgi:Flp pilus assembly protein TadG
MKRKLANKDSRGAAIVEFAVVLPILLLLVFGIIDFGLLFYNDLRLTQAARDAARYVSVNDVAVANDTIDDAVAQLVNVDPLTRDIDQGGQGEASTVTLVGTYSWLTPLPGLIPGLGASATFDASAVMRQE